MACAESLTGGALAALLSSLPGASAVFRGGVVSYATDVKESVLGVSHHVLSTSGPISAECAAAMAVGVRRVLDADWGVSTTGVAGPDRPDGHPVGQVFVGLAGPGGRVRVVELVLAGTRDQIRARTCDEVLGLLHGALR